METGWVCVRDSRGRLVWAVRAKDIPVQPFPLRESLRWIWRDRSNEPRDPTTLLFGSTASDRAEKLLEWTPAWMAQIHSEILSFYAGKWIDVAPRLKHRIEALLMAVGSADVRLCAQVMANNCSDPLDHLAVIAAAHEMITSENA